MPVSRPTFRSLTPEYWTNSCSWNRLLEPVRPSSRRRREKRVDAIPAQGAGRRARGAHPGYAGPGRCRPLMVPGSRCGSDFVRRTARRPGGGHGDRPRGRMGGGLDARRLRRFHRLVRFDRKHIAELSGARVFFTSPRYADDPTPGRGFSRVYSSAPIPGGRSRWLIGHPGQAGFPACLSQPGAS